MVSAALPVASSPINGSDKVYPGNAPPSLQPAVNVAKTNGVHHIEKIKNHVNGVNGLTNPESYVNGYHSDIPKPAQRVVEPENSSEAVFGRKDKTAPYAMLNQPLGQKRPLKVIYLGGGASGELDYNPNICTWRHALNQNGDDRQASISLTGPGHTCLKPN
jgi:hypothetical protein